MPCTVKEHLVRSVSLGRDMPAFVILPEGYEDNREHFPVLYLLHGWAGDHTNWVTLTRLTEYAARYRFLIVTPTGENSWYINSATTPEARFADYLVHDLVTSVESTFRCDPSPLHRAIAGLSMGGYGAILAALRNPAMFNFAGSLSGAFNGPCGIEEIVPELKPSTDAAYGPNNHPCRREHDLREIIASLANTALPYLYMSCGTEDTLLPANREMAAQCSAHKLRYEYHEVPGGHDWSYWDSALPALLHATNAWIAL